MSVFERVEDDLNRRRELVGVVESEDFCAILSAELLQFVDWNLRDDASRDRVALEIGGELSFDLPFDDRERPLRMRDASSRRSEREIELHVHHAGADVVSLSRRRVCDALQETVVARRKGVRRIDRDEISVAVRDAVL